MKIETAMFSGNVFPPGDKWNCRILEIASGKLPPGLKLDAGNGSIEGVPEKAGDYSFSILMGGLNCICGKLQEHWKDQTWTDSLRIIVVGD